MCWLNNVTPKNNAVMGSKEPKRAVFVAPISFIDSVIVSIEIIVGIIAKPIAQSHKNGLFITWSFVQKFKLNIYKKSPKNIT